MAVGIRQACSAFVAPAQIIGISISGIAGPTGGTSQKPVGTVWIGCSTHEKNLAFHFHFDGNREIIKRQSAIKALQIILENTPI